jgi:hypothetical protein
MRSPPENESLGGGEATEAKQLSGISAKASAQDTLRPSFAASPVRSPELDLRKARIKQTPTPCERAQRLPCVLTFVEPARKVVDAFCSSAGLIRPVEPDIEVELKPAHVLHRYVYFRIEQDEDGAPKITRFLDRAAALAANPALATVAIIPQEPLALPVVHPPAR